MINNNYVMKITINPFIYIFFVNLGPNSGIWIAKNSPWSKKFLKLAYDQKQFDKKRSPEVRFYIKLKYLLYANI